MSTIVLFLRTLPLAAYLSAGLALSVLLNLNQYGNAQAAEAECKAKLAQSALESKIQLDKERAAAQKAVDQSAVDDADLERETLAAIAAGVNRTQYQLSQAARANPSPISCRVQPDRLRVVNAALSVPRASRPSL